LSQSDIRKSRIPVAVAYELDFAGIMDKLAADLGMHRNGQLLTLLNNLPFDGQHFKFVFDKNSTHLIFVQCPHCQSKRLKLYKVDDLWSCRECHHLDGTNGENKGSTREKPVSTVYSRYLRPLRKMVELEERLLTEELTLRQRQILEKKLRTLQLAVPESIQALRTRINLKLDKL